MSKLTDNWKYEKQGWDTDSQLKDRALFLEKITELRWQVINSLFETCFVSFISFVGYNLRHFLTNVTLPPNPTRNELFSYLWNIPKQEVEIITIGGWNALPHKDRTEDLRSKLQKWSEDQHITPNWCLDHAIKVLQSWMYDDRIRSLDLIPPTLLTPARLAGELSFGWQDAVNELEFSLLFSRSMLSIETLSSESGDPPAFVFEREGLRFETAGWDYLHEGKREWKKTVEKEFDKFRTQLKVKEQTVPKGILTAFRAELADYAKKQDAEKRATIKEHGLVKRPRRYAEHSPEEHIKWLIMYQIPPCQKYGEMAEQANTNLEIVKKMCQGYRETY